MSRSFRTAIVAAIPPAPATPSEPQPAPAAAPRADFEVIGAVRPEAADDTWVDLMGVVANRTDTGYRLATFDASLYDESGALICVDTVSSMAGARVETDGWGLDYVLTGAQKALALPPGIRAASAVALTSSYHQRSTEVPFSTRTSIIWVISGPSKSAA